jgi:uncharacterized membrane protein YoaK (UPF0700 family)
MSYWIDAVAFVLASDLFAASITGKFVSVGRGGGRNTTYISSTWLKLALFSLASLLTGAIIWHLRKALGN